jgi:hypothetical protein
MWDFFKPFRVKTLTLSVFFRSQIVPQTKTGFIWILGLKRDLVFQGKLTDATSGFSRNWKSLYTDVRRFSTG